VNTAQQSSDDLKIKRWYSKNGKWSANILNGNRITVFNNEKGTENCGLVYASGDIMYFSESEIPVYVRYAINRLAKGLHPGKR